MELNYECTVDDVVAFTLYNSPDTTNAWREKYGSRLTLSVLFTLIVAAAGIAGLRGVYPVMLAIAAGLGLVFYLTYPLSRRQKDVGTIRKWLEQDRHDAMFGPQSLVLSPEGVFTTNRDGKSKVNWPAVEKLGEGEKHLYIYLSPVRAIIVPKRCFKSEDDKREFLQLVEEYRGKA